MNKPGEDVIKWFKTEDILDTLERLKNEVNSAIALIENGMLVEDPESHHKRMMVGDAYDFSLGRFLIKEVKEKHTSISYK